MFSMTSREMMGEKGKKQNGAWAILLNKFLQYLFLLLQELPYSIWHAFTDFYFLLPLPKHFLTILVPIALALPCLPLFCITLSWAPTVLPAKNTATIDTNREDQKNQI